MNPTYSYLMRRILITGAASAIAQATARLYAKEGASLFLVDRDSTRLAAVANDLKVRGATQVHTKTLDLNQFAQHQALLDEAIGQLGSIDIALIAHGTLPKQKECEQSWEKTSAELTTNFISAASLLTRLANYFETKQAGTIAVISSVAGDRGRASNYVYGSAKGALTIFTDGLRNRLHKRGVHVLTIKPGFVDTPMTADFKKGFLWAKPEAIARGIYRAIEDKEDKVYLPGFWRLIMFAIRNIPERIFKNMRL